MFLKNITQTPNIIFNELMIEMTDTDLRVVLTITRQTLGWVLDPTTGKRKEEDWIPYSQLARVIGRKRRVLTDSIKRCVEKGWIETRDGKGKILSTPELRERQQIFYRLGEKILSTVMKTAGADSAPAKEVAGADRTPAGADSAPARVFTGADSAPAGADSAPDGSFAGADSAPLQKNDYDIVIDNDNDIQKFKNLDSPTVDKVIYLTEKMNEKTHLYLYLKIANQIGIGKLEQAIGLTLEDPKIKNKGAYMVAICKKAGYKPNSSV